MWYTAYEVFNMIDALKGIWDKYRDTIKYLVFGMLTTIVNFVIYYLLYNLACFSAAFSNGISWLASVLFAFVTNKLYVFESRDWNSKVSLPEFGKFFGCRLFSGFIETAFLYVMVDLLLFDGNVWKVVIAVVVVVLNYFASKFFIFQDNKKSPEL